MKFKNSPSARKVEAITKTVFDPETMTLALNIEDSDKPKLLIFDDEKDLKKLRNNLTTDEPTDGKKEKDKQGKKEKKNKPKC